MANFICIKETWFKCQLYKPGQVYNGDNAPEAYFKKTGSGGKPADRQPRQRIKAEGKSISPDLAATQGYGE